MEDARKIIPVRFSPVVQRQITFALFAGKIGVHFIVLTNGNFDGLDNTERLTASIEHNCYITYFRDRVSFCFPFPYGRAGGSFSSLSNERAEFICQFMVVSPAFRDVGLGMIGRVGWKRG